MIDYAMSEADYHSRSELSSTGARRLLDSPARFRYWQDHPQPSKPSFDLGSAAHAKILGVGANVVLYPEEHLTPSGNVSTKAATVEWEQEQRAVGLIPICASDARKVDAMAEAVLADRDARGVLETITGREVSIVTQVDGVPVRARFDIYGGTRAGDLKTTRDASPRGFNRSVGTYGYHVQKAWYDDAHKAETGQALSSFTFIVVESAPPHLVGVYELDFMWTDLAAGLAQKARRLWLECTQSGEWPGYGAATLTAPTWAVYDADEEEIKI
jgi:exodeoxyribonuclease VIII